MKSKILRCTCNSDNSNRTECNVHFNDKKPPEPTPEVKEDWEEEFDRVFIPDEMSKTKCMVWLHEIKKHVNNLLSKQRQQLLEELKKEENISYEKGFQTCLNDLKRFLKNYE